MWPGTDSGLGDGVETDLKDFLEGAAACDYGHIAR